jgi:hypothetical protein
MTRRGSIELARKLCHDIAGPTDEEDMVGAGYGSVAVAEILSGEVVRLNGVIAGIQAELHLWENFQYLTDREQVMNLVTAVRKIIEAGGGGVGDGFWG